MKLNKRKIWILFLLCLLIMLAVFIPAYSGDIDLPKDDEIVICFTTAAGYDPATDIWSVPVKGRIFEPEQDDILRNILIDAIKKTGDFDESDLAADLFTERVRDFLADNEGWKRLDAVFGKIPYTLAKTHQDGIFSSVMLLTNDQLAGFENNGWINYSIQTREDDNRNFSGRIKVVRPGTTCVISDIDDTIKITGVTDRSQLMKNIFARPYQPTDGMVEYYQQMENDGCCFFYVSASPIQLYRPLSEWMLQVGYPAGEINLRDFYIADSRAFNMLKQSGNVKQPVIRQIIERYPDCNFILIGDAGEQDALIYGELARKFPNQIEKIQIRALTSPDKAEVDRLRLMAGIIPDRCIFEVLWQGKPSHF